MTIMETISNFEELKDTLLILHKDADYQSVKEQVDFCNTMLKSLDCAGTAVGYWQGIPKLSACSIQDIATEAQRGQIQNIIRNNHYQYGLDRVTEMDFIGIEKILQAHGCEAFLDGHCCTIKELRQITSFLEDPQLQASGQNKDLAEDYFQLRAMQKKIEDIKLQGLEGHESIPEIYVQVQQEIDDTEKRMTYYSPDLAAYRIKETNAMLESTGTGLDEAHTRDFNQAKDCLTSNMQPADYRNIQTSCEAIALFVCAKELAAEIEQQQELPTFEAAPQNIQTNILLRKHEILALSASPVKALNAGLLVKSFSDAMNAAEHGTLEDLSEKLSIYSYMIESDHRLSSRRIANVKTLEEIQGKPFKAVNIEPSPKKLRQVLHISPKNPEHGHGRELER